MKKIFAVAICFAAMGHVVAFAQEAPVISMQVAAKDAPAKPTKAKPVERFSGQPSGSGMIKLTPEARAKAIAAGKASAASARGTEKVAPKAYADKDADLGIDPVKTSSVASVKPRVATKESKSGEKVAPKALSKGAYGSIIARYASAYGVPVSLAHAVIRVESNYRANARGSAGEIGLMQIKPATARGLGYSGSASGLFNPETNIKYGMKYLGMAHKLGGGSTCGTILKYNAGHGAKRMNPISANYCAKVKRHLSS
jgi:soluble lytic murein transglycosylase-like protein